MSVESQKTIAVTGINGFVGKHLTRELVEHDIAVVGIGMEQHAHEEIAGLLDSYYAANLTEEWPIKAKLDAVIHLAGLAAVGPSFDAPQKYIALNSAMVTNMAEYYVRVGNAPRLVVVSSGSVYSSDQEMPLTEESDLKQTSPYVVSKVLVENLCEYYQGRGLDCVVMRPFNHIGPGQLGGFLVPDVIERLQDATEEIPVGNIETRRDYTDVRDVVAAYRLVATAPTLEHRVYNVCSGESVSGAEIIDTLKKLMGKEGVATVVDKSMVRPTDAPNIVGDANRLKADTGWGPKIPLETTLRDCVE